MDKFLISVAIGILIGIQIAPFFYHLAYLQESEDTPVNKFITSDEVEEVDY